MKKNDVKNSNIVQTKGGFSYDEEEKKTLDAYLMHLSNETNPGTSGIIGKNIKKIQTLS